MKKVILSVLMILSAGIAFSQYINSLDPNFGSGGIATLDAGSAKAVAVYKDKILLAGYANGGTEVIVWRLNTDGTADKTFGSAQTGEVRITVDGTPVTVTSMAVNKNNGTIYIAGSSGISTATTGLDGFVTSLTSDGYPNTAFGPKNTGTSILQLLGTQNFGTIGLQSAGKIVVAGDSAGVGLAIRFNTDGSRDKTFTNGIPPSAFSRTITNIDINAQDQILLTDDYYQVYIIKLLKDGLADNSFGSKGVYLIANTYYYNAAGIKFLSDGRIVAGVGGGGSYSFMVYCFKADGRLDSTSFNGSGQKDTSITSYDYPQTMVVDQHDRIILSGQSYTSQYVPSAVRFLPDGSIDKNFGAVIPNGYGNIYTSVITPDEKLILAGDDGSNNIIAMKVNLKYAYNLTFSPIPIKYIGSDPFALQVNTFLKLASPLNLTYNFSKPIATVSGNMATVKDTGTAIITAFTPGTPYVAGGKEFYPDSAKTTLVVEQLPPAIIVGKKYVTPNTVETYSVFPFDSAAFYVWNYTDTTAGRSMILGKSNTDSLKIYFSPIAQNGLLQVIIRNGNFINLLEKNIIVVPDSGLGHGSLPPLECPPVINSCLGNYIDDFSLHTIENISSGCSMAGYADYTDYDSSIYHTTLLMGENYTAQIKIGNPANLQRYVGVWIDYNNDGDFHGADEFLGVDFTDASNLTIDGIFIKNNLSYAGVRRLRVTCRSNTITAGDACTVSGESGETEDYSVTIKLPEALQGPNAITPNNDGKNDYLVFRGVDAKASNKLVVFDRMGDVKYTMENYDNRWDGKNDKGEVLPKGTYYYVFTNGDRSLKSFFEMLY